MNGCTAVLCNPYCNIARKCGSLGSIGEEVLRGCEEAVQKATGYTIQLAEKCLRCETVCSKCRCRNPEVIDPSTLFDDTEQGRQGQAAELQEG